MNDAAGEEKRSRLPLSEVPRMKRSLKVKALGAERLLDFSLEVKHGAEQYSWRRVCATYGTAKHGNMVSCGKCG